MWSEGVVSNYTIFFILIKYYRYDFYAPAYCNCYYFRCNF